MNWENLHELINRYEENIYTLNDSKNDEKFKWHAVQRFQDAWFDPDADTLPFSELFHNAIKGSSILVNNGTVQPANGVVKLAEKAPEEVERLFREVLFADDDDDLDVRQEHMEEFLEGMEALLPKYLHFSRLRISSIAKMMLLPLIYLTKIQTNHFRRLHQLFIPAYIVYYIK